jgi:hypothetical protein
MLINSNNIKKPSKKAIGKKFVFDSFSSANFKFNIISINKNSTAIAPTYMTIKDIGMNSKSNNKSMQATLKKVNTRNKTEKIGFLVYITKIADNSEKAVKMK